MSVFQAFGISTFCSLVFVESAWCDSTTDKLCGPRAVHRVLQMLNRQEYLADVVSDLEVQCKGEKPSLDDLKNALEAKGVYCCFAQVNAWCIPSWSYPMILHIDGDHFVILEKSNLLSAEIYDGLAGKRRELWISFRPRCSNQVLLTSPQPIHEDISLSSIYVYMFIGFGIGFFSLGAYSLYKLKIRDKRQPIVPVKEV